MAARAASGRAPWVLVASGFNHRGGMERANLRFAEHLLREEMPVHLVAFDVDRQLSEEPGATVHAVHQPGGSYLLGERRLDRVGRRVAAATTKADPRTRVLVNGGNCLWGDINWVHFVHRAWRSDASHAPLWFRAKERILSRAARAGEAAALGRAKLVFANSDRTRDDLIRYVQVRPDRVHRVYLGVDPVFGAVAPEERAAARRWLGRPDDRPLVVFVGALGYDRRKGFDTLWSAWLELCARADWDADLVVVGVGREADHWRAAARGAGLESRIRFLGFSDRVQDVLAAADLLVSPTRYESYGLNVQEALCRGVPALVSASAGVAEHYPADLDPLLLKDANDVRELRDLLIAWRGRIAEVHALVRPLAASVRARSWSKMAAEMVAIAEGTAQSRLPARRAALEGSSADRGGSR